MKTKTINIYEFKELSDQAKENVIAWYRSHLDEIDYNFNEIIDTLEKFCGLFDIKLKNFTLGNYTDIICNYNCDDIEVKGLRLRTWLINNFYSDLYKPKFLCITNGHYGAIGIGSKTKYSKVFIDNNCVLTGCCYDYDILDPIYNFIEKFDIKKDRYTTLEDLLSDCVRNYENIIEKHVEYIESDEYITENILVNEYTFNESGEREDI